jgi:hypothetical protein
MFSLARYLRGLLDERFVLHRYKSTSHAAMAAALVMGGWYFYDLFVNSVIRWDLLLILGVMALVRVAFLLWYRLRD